MPPPPPTPPTPPLPLFLAMSLSLACCASSGVHLIPWWPCPPHLKHHSTPSKSLSFFCRVLRPLSPSPLPPPSSPSKPRFPLASRSATTPSSFTAASSSSSLSTISPSSLPASSSSSSSSSLSESESELSSVSESELGRSSHTSCPYSPQVMHLTALFPPGSNKAERGYITGSEVHLCRY